MEEGVYAIVAILIVVLLIVAGIVLYFLPSIIAYKKGHTNKGIILLIDFLLGWTFLGWAGSLVWAFIDTDGTATSNALRNVGGNKYEDLAKLQKLKESGAITDVEFEIEKQKLYNAISALPKKQRKRIILYYFNNLTQDQMAKKEKCSIRAIQYSLSIALKNLRKFLK